MTNKLSDYRNCAYFTKARLQKVAGACGVILADSLSKEEMVKNTKEAQERVIAVHGNLFKGEY